jgi:DNA N-6-adenine-methyltransferase (Dam)
MLTLDEARKLFAKSSNCLAALGDCRGASLASSASDAQGGGFATDDAVRAIVDIAVRAQDHQAGWGRLRLEALRQLGRFLIRSGRAAGRPAKSSDGEDKQTLVRLGINDHHISADAKSVARISQKDFDAYLASEPEPTLAGMLRYGEAQRATWPSNAAKSIFASERSGRSFLDPHDATSVVEWYTPPEIFDSLETEFDLDVASPGRQFVPWVPARRHLTRVEDGLVADWAGFIWMNPPYGLQHGVADWITNFVRHRDGLALLPDFTSAAWWQDAAGSADAIMFVCPKISFLPKRADGRSNSLGSTLVAIGERGVAALRNAERNGRGIMFERTAALRARSIAA